MIATWLDTHCLCLLSSFGFIYLFHWIVFIHQFICLFRAIQEVLLLLLHLVQQRLLLLIAAIATGQQQHQDGQERQQIRQQRQVRIWSVHRSHDTANNTKPAMPPFPAALRPLEEQVHLHLLPLLHLHLVVQIQIPNTSHHLKTDLIWASRGRAGQAMSCKAVAKRHQQTEVAPSPVNHSDGIYGSCCCVYRPIVRQHQLTPLAPLCNVSWCNIYM